MSQLPMNLEHDETPEQKRKRLAQELRYLHQQLISKVAELQDEGLDVDFHYSNGDVRRNETIVHIDISYQTQRRFYR